MKNTNTKTLTRVALLVAIEVVMKLVGLNVCFQSQHTY